MMKDVTVTAKIQIYPTDEEQAGLFTDTSGAYVRACSFLAEEIYKSHELNFNNLNRRYYRYLRENFSLKAQFAQSAIRRVTANFKTVLTNTSKWKKLHYRAPSVDLVFNRDWSIPATLQDTLIKDKQESEYWRAFSINTLQERVKLTGCIKGFEQYFDGTWRFGTARLVQKTTSRKGRTVQQWFLHIPVTKAFKEPENSEITNVVGVDRGINFLAVTRDDHQCRFYSGREAKHKRAHFKNKREELQRRHTPAARQRLAATGRREHCWMTGVNHRLSKTLVEHAQHGSLIVLEDLKGIAAASAKVRRKERYIHISWAYRQLQEMIVYKAAMRGCTVVFADPKYSSQTCPECGQRERANRDRKHHAFKCRRCGRVYSNDDLTASINLRNKGLEHLEKSRLSTSSPRGGQSALPVNPV